MTTHRPSSYPAASLRSARVANEMATCRARGCASHRYGIEAYCRFHRGPFKKYGHPLARSIDPREWRRELKEVRELFDGHPDHAGLVSVLQWTCRWLAEAKAAAGNPKAPQGSEEVSRLANYGISPLEVVTAACAFRVWEFRNPRACPDEKAWVYALARAVLGLAPRPRRAYRPGTRTARQQSRQPTFALPPKASSVEAIGKLLREVWSAFYVTVWQALEQREQQKLELVAAMRAPFEPPRAALVADVASCT